MIRHALLRGALALPLVAAPVLAQTQQQPAQAAQSPGDQPQTGASPGTTRRAEVLTTEGFLHEASMSDRYDTAASRLVAEETRQNTVRRFAERMVEAHMQTTRELQQVMQQVPGAGAGADTPLPQGREARGNAQSGRITNAQGGPQHEGLDQRHAALLEQLHRVTGAERDRLYATQQVAAHQQAVDMYRAYAGQGDNAAVRAFAAKTLPVLERHLREAQELQRGL